MLSRKSAQTAAAAVAAEARSDASTKVALDRLKRFAAKATSTEDTGAGAGPGVAVKVKSKDGRRAPRKSSVIGATITAKSMVAERPCKVVDMSATGARLRILPTSDQLRGLPAGVPDTFTLILRVDRLEIDCEVAWRKDREIGIRFAGLARPLAKGR